MDEALKKEIGELMESRLKAELQTVISQIGQVAETAKKFGEALPVIEKNQKILSDTVAAQKSVTADDVKKLIGSELTAAQQAAAAKAEEAAELRTERDAFIADKLKGIPAAYHSLLGDDKAKWGEAEKSIRDTFAADAKAAGLQVANVGGSGGGSAVQSTGTAGGGFLTMPGGK